jgi:hypothetical protein
MEGLCALLGGNRFRVITFRGTHRGGSNKWNTENRGRHRGALIYRTLRGAPTEGIETGAPIEALTNGTLKKGPPQGALTNGTRPISPCFMRSKKISL